MKQTFLDETHIPAFQRGFSSGPSWTDGDGLQMACGASGYMTWPHWGLNNPLHIPSSPLHSASTASPRLAQITSRPTPGSGWLGSCPHKTFSVSLTIFSLILAMFWQLQSLFFSSLSTCLVLRATGETQNPAEHPGMQSICNESQLQRCQRGLFQTERGNEGGGVRGSCRACVKGWTRKEARQHWLKGGKKTTRKNLYRDHSSETSPPAPHGWSCQLF